MNAIGHIYLLSCSDRKLSNCNLHTKYKDFFDDDNKEEQCFSAMILMANLKHKKKLEIVKL